MEDEKFRIVPITQSPQINQKKLLFPLIAAFVVVLLFSIFIIYFFYTKVLPSQLPNSKTPTLTSSIYDPLSFSTSVVFATKGDTNDKKETIYELNLLNTKTKKITHLESLIKPNGFAKAGPLFSPDKTHIAFSNNHNVFIIKANDAKKPIQVTSEGAPYTDEFFSVEPWKFMWSADSSMLSFIMENYIPGTDIDLKQKSRGFQNGLYIVNRDGKNKNFIGSEMPISFGVDNNTFFVLGYNKELKHDQTDLWNYTTKMKIPVIEGKRLVKVIYSRKGIRHAYGLSNLEVYSTFSRDFSDNGLLQFVGSTLLDISEDGNRILAWRQLQFGGGELIIRDLEADTNIPLITLPHETSAYFVNNGKAIVFLEFPLLKDDTGEYYSQGGDLYMLDLLSLEKTKLTDGLYIENDYFHY